MSKNAPTMDAAKLKIAKPAALQVPEAERTGKRFLLELLIKRKHGLQKKHIYLECGVDDGDEMQRRKIWQIGQNLAELYITGYIDIVLYDSLEGTKKFYHAR